MHFERMNILASGLRGALFASVAAALLAGCANRDSITVGSVPDDYRTNHPIVISEKEKALDIPVASTDRGITKTQKVAIEGFASSYDRSAAAPVTILVPSGSANQTAASVVAQDLVKVMKRNGIPRSRIAIASYQADSAETAAPIRVSYVAMTAHTNQCGRWPEDAAPTSENKHYANFGCAYQNNLAAQIANPADLLGPRKPGDVDAERRNIILDDYRNATVDDVGNIQY